MCGRNLLNLNRYFRSVFEMKHQPLVSVYRYMVNNCIPQRFGEGNLQQIQFLQGKQATAYGISLDLPTFFLLLQRIIFCLEVFISSNQGIVAADVCSLGHGLCGIFVYQALNHPGNYIQFPQNVITFGVNGAALQ